MILIAVWEKLKCANLVVDKSIHWQEQQSQNFVNLL